MDTTSKYCGPLFVGTTSTPQKAVLNVGPGRTPLEINFPFSVILAPVEIESDNDNVPIGMDEGIFAR
jgi:hypothetical protein